MFQLLVHLCSYVRALMDLQDLLEFQDSEALWVSLD